MAQYNLKGKRTFVAGHRGMVGSALCRRLARDEVQLLTTPREETDLTNQAAVERYFEAERPQAVFIAAAKVGGIHANNSYRADFIHDNLAIALNLISAAHRYGVEKLMYLGSSCIYPRLARQPMDEGQLLQGALEPTNEPYAIAKIAGLKLAENFRRQYGDDFISVMPTNLYNPGDNYHPENSHVAPALIRRFHEAKLSGVPSVTIWGTGSPRREFLYVDDFADACVHVMSNYSDIESVNVGTGQDVTIRELAEKVSRTVGYQGELIFDAIRPDGPPRKLLNVAKLNGLGWRATTSLEEGLAKAYADFVAHPGVRA